jgi:hypothetical protein
MQEIFAGKDIALAVLYFSLILLVSIMRTSSSNDDLKRKYYTKGLLIKLAAALVYILVYFIYYKGVSDTYSYFRSAQSLANMLSHDFSIFLKVFFGDDASAETLSHFTYQTGYLHGARDPHVFAVNRFSSIFVFLGGGSLMAASFLLAAFLYQWVFRLFRFLVVRFPDVKPIYFFIAVLSPSAVFWSAGILKDSFTYAAVCLVIPSLFSVFEGKFKFKSLFFILLGFYIIYELKPYILFALIGGIGIGFFILFLRKLPKGFLRVVLAPALTVLLFIIVMWGINVIGTSLGGIYSTPDKMLLKAQETQQDLIREQYGDNSFDIGYFDASISGVAQKTPQALIAGLYRPFVWEAGSVFILISALENLILIILTILFFLRGGLRIIGKLLGDPFLGFALVFVLFMAFSVGLSTANFGALVRYKIPILPFLISFLMIGLNEIKKKNAVRKENQ